jgi:hypothetical protein
MDPCSIQRTCTPFHYTETQHLWLHRYNHKLNHGTHHYMTINQNQKIGIYMFCLVVLKIAKLSTKFIYSSTLVALIVNNQNLKLSRFVLKQPIMSRSLKPSIVTPKFLVISSSKTFNCHTQIFGYFKLLVPWVWRGCQIPNFKYKDEQCCYFDIDLLLPINKMLMPWVWKKWLDSQFFKYKDEWCCFDIISLLPIIRLVKFRHSVIKELFMAWACMRWLESRFQVEGWVVLFWHCYTITHCHVGQIQILFYCYLLQQSMEVNKCIILRIIESNILN